MTFRKFAPTFVLLLAIPLTAQTLAQSAGAQSAGTKSDVEKRLKAQEKPAAPEIDAVVKTLRPAHRFAETEISPDGTHVAWVETLTGEDGAPNGNTAIYVTNLKTDSVPVRVTAGTLGKFRNDGMIFTHRRLVRRPSHTTAAVNDK